MKTASSSKETFGRAVALAVGPYVLAPDRFKEIAEAAAAKKGGRPKGDAFAGTGRGLFDAFRPAGSPSPAPVRAAAFRPAAPPRGGRMLANGAALHVIASQPRELAAGAIRDRRAAKSSSLVLVTSAGPMTASEMETLERPPEVVTPPKVEKPAATPPPPPKRTGGGGGGGGSGGGGDGGGPRRIAAAVAPRDRIFNQDDLMGVAIVLAMLLLLALYLLRGGAGAVQEPERLVDVQSAATQPVAPPVVGPLPDPYGDKAVDLTPKTPLPVTPEVAVATPPPAVVIDVRFNAYFCTAKYDLTPAAASALDKQIAVWESLEGKAMLVTGYADTRGESAYNTWLSGERARTVAEYLKTKGIDARASGAGELPGLADNQNCANQRRVDVRLADAPAEPPSPSCAPPPDAAEMVCG